MAQLSETAISILERRYVRKNEEGEQIETPQELFERVANAVALADKVFNTEADVQATAKEFYELMTSFDFLPNSPTLMNAGTDDGQLSACFVLPIEDSMEGIFGTLKEAALIHKTGGGTGFSFSRLRPSNSVVKSTGGVASGPISFMSAYNAATETVKQGGKRRGANMGMLRVDHPDILAFIDCKKDLTQLTNFNVSVAITDEFMTALNEDLPYNIYNPSNPSEVLDQKSAKEVWDKIIEAAWMSAEPGIFFIDRTNAENPTPALGLFETTNPCGEQPLLPYESCNLGSINLLNMYCAKSNSIDMKKLASTVHKAVHFLDNVIEINKYPLKEIEEATLKTRKIGLGVMGWADLLLKLDIEYGSEESLGLASNIMYAITEEARLASDNLGKERGCFAAKPDSIWKEAPYRRHAAVTTIAPTGTISMLAGVSSGIEPVFGFAYVKTVMDNDHFVDINKVLLAKLHKEGLYTQQIINSLVKTGRVTQVSELPESIRKVYVCAHDITPINHIRMQASFQASTDNAISKTINFPSTSTLEDFDEGYRLAYTLGCKGVTAYRDGCRVSQVLTMGTSVPGTTEVASDKVRPRSRSKMVRGFTEKIMTGCGNLYVTVNFDDDGVCEVLTNSGKAGGCHSQSEASARLATLALRSNVSYSAIINQLSGIRCPSAIRNNKSECLSCPDAIARVLKHGLTMIGNGTEKSLGIPVDEALNNDNLLSTSSQCPECSQLISYAEGCIVCPSCGYSKCN